MVFKTKSNYRSHLATHQDEREVFRCHYPMCKRWYTKSSNLAFHIKEYHESKRFKCTVEGCTTRFISRASRTRHLKNCHSDETKEVKINDIAKPKKARKDIFLPKKSTAADLSGIGFDPRVSKDILANGEVELTKESLEREIRENDDVKNIADQSYHDTETDRETEAPSESNYESDSIIYKMPISVQRKIQNIFQSEDDATDREHEMEDLRAPKINEKEEKKFDYSLFIT